MRRTTPLFRRYAVGHVLLLGGLALSACSTETKSSAPAPAIAVTSSAAAAPAMTQPSTSAVATPTAAATAASTVSGRPTTATGSGPNTGRCPWNADYPHTMRLKEVSRQDGGVLGVFTPGHWTCGTTSAFVADGPSRPMTITPGTTILATAPLTGDSHPTPFTVDQLIAAAQKNPGVAFEVTTDTRGQVVRLQSIYQE